MSDEKDIEPLLRDPAEVLRAAGTDLFLRPRELIAEDQIQVPQKAPLLRVRERCPCPADILRSGQEQKAAGVSPDLARHIAEAPVGAQDLQVLPGNPGPGGEPGDAGDPAHRPQLREGSRFLCFFLPDPADQGQHGGGPAVEAAVPGIGDGGPADLRVVPQVLEDGPALVDGDRLLSGQRAVLLQKMEDAPRAKDQLGLRQGPVRLECPCIADTDADPDQGEALFL